MGVTAVSGCRAEMKNKVVLANEVLAIARTRRVARARFVFEASPGWLWCRGGLGPVRRRLTDVAAAEAPRADIHG